MDTSANETNTYSVTSLVTGQTYTIAIPAHLDRLNVPPVFFLDVTEDGQLTMKAA